MNQEQNYGTQLIQYTEIKKPASLLLQLHPSISMSSQSPSPTPSIRLTWKSLTLRQKLRVVGCLGGTLLFIAGAIALGLFVNYRLTPTPIISIEQFDVITLNQTTNSTNTSHIINFKLKFWHWAKKYHGLSYDTVNLTFYYRKPNLSFVPVAYADFDPFYGEARRFEYREGQVEPSGVVWEKSLAAMFFKVELRTAVKQWLKKRKHIAVRAVVQVNDQGRLTKKDRGTVLVRSEAGRINASSFRTWAISSVLIAAFHF